MHQQLIDSSGGLPGVRDEGLLESAIATPLQSFDDEDLYLEVASGKADERTLHRWIEAHLT